MSSVTDLTIPRDHILWILTTRAINRANDIAVSFMIDSRGTRSQLTWAGLRDSALAAKSALKRAGLKSGDRLLLSLPAGEAHLATVLGAIWAGILPSSAQVSPRREGDGGKDLDALIAALRPSAVVSANKLRLPGVPILNPDDILAGDSSESDPTNFSEVQSLTYVQFTSGSTGHPKGVGLEWGAIARNLDGITKAAPLTPNDHVVSWLPMYHDMGWFGGLLAPLYADCQLTIMDVGLFVLNPLLWIRLIEDTKATITVTPPSALKTSMDLLKRREANPPDLSSLRQIICGSEPVSPQLIKNFKDILVPLGVPESALKPVYGLAEATLAVTFPPCSRKVRVDRVPAAICNGDHDSRQVVPINQGDFTEHVSVGIPLEGITVGVFDDSGHPVTDRAEGHIKIRSPSQMSRILRDGVLIPYTENWIETGDLGFLSGEELYITGRQKEVIIKFGEKYAPDRIEEAACRVKEVRRAAAFGMFDESRLTDRAVLLVELGGAASRSAFGRDRARLAIRSELQSAGYSIDEIVFVRKGGLPLTTSGKIRRWRCRELFLAEALEVAEGQ